jgi:hypothetical protein
MVVFVDLTITDRIIKILSNKLSTNTVKPVANVGPEKCIVVAYVTGT